MKFLILAIIVLTFITDVGAQIKPAQSQYLDQKGALVNLGFEQGFKGWTFSGCTKSLVSDVPYLNKTLKLTCVNETFSVKQETTDLIALADTQGLATCKIKTTASGVKFKALSNGVEDASVLVNSGAYKTLSVPSVINSTSNGVEIAAESNYTGDVYIDDCTYGEAPRGFISSISGAFFVGDAYYNETAGCTWAGGSGSFANFGANATCPAPIVRGGLADPLNDQPSIKILNARTDGYYRVEAQGFIYFSSGTDGFLRLYDGTNGGGISAINDNADSRNFPSLSHNFRFTTTGDKTIQLQAKSSSVISVLNDTAGRRLYFAVHFYPDNNSTVATQNKELTAETANHLSARVGQLSANVQSVNYYFKNGNKWLQDSNVNKTGIGQYTIDYSSLGLSTIPAINCTLHAGADGSTMRKCHVFNVSTTAATIITNEDLNNTRNYYNQDFSIFLDKQEADVTRNANIVGKFEQIGDTETIRVKYKRTATQFIPATTYNTIVWNNLVYDNSNGAYNPSTGVFTSPRDTYYNLCAKIVYDSILWNNDTYTFFYLERSVGEDDVLGSRFNASTKTYNLHLGSNCVDLFLNKGETLAIQLWQNDGNKDVLASSNNNYFTLHEIPDKESIVKNLNKNNNVECDLKVLTSSATNTTGGFENLADLQFNNLTVGKKYRVHVSGAINGTSGDDSLQVRNGSTTLLSIRNRTPSLIVGGQSTNFIATSTTLQGGNNSGVGGQVLGNGHLDLTWVQLCELPDNTILGSNKFD